MQADRNTTNIRSFYSDETTVREIDDYIKTAVSSTNFDSFTDVNDGVRL
ncbi:hypothetical protein T03_10190 [Trichinella britovi]|uniref:Uncharacterized protein n=1 Tax=Trichinella britovi TaxID=45882 RepID=A0A0V0YYL3_TRIBR|nr:hypothetical protein T03_10190 [Trichinella britovi]